MILSASAFLTGPAYWYLIKDKDYRLAWYDLLDHANTSRPIWQIRSDSMVIFRFAYRAAVCNFEGDWLNWHRESFQTDKVVRNEYTGAFGSFQIDSPCSGQLNWSLRAPVTFLISSVASVCTPSLGTFYRNETDRTLAIFPGTDNPPWSQWPLVESLLKNYFTHFGYWIQQILVPERVFKSMYSQWALSTLKNFLSTNSPDRFETKSFPHRNSDDLISAFQNASLKSKFVPAGSNCKTNFKFFDPENKGIIEVKRLEIVFGDEDARKVQLLLSKFERFKQFKCANINSRNWQGHAEKSIQSIYQDRWDLNVALTTHASIIKNWIVSWSASSFP